MDGEPEVDPYGVRAVTSRGRLRNPRGEGGVLRVELIAAATDLIEELGDPSQLTLRKVAKRAAIAPPSVYLQFSDLASLVDAVLRSALDQLRVTIALAASTVPEEEEKLRAGCLAYIEFALHRPAVYRALFTVVRVPTGMGALEGMPALGDLAEAAGGRHQGLNLWCALHGLALLRSSRPEVPWSPLAEQIDELIAALAKR